MRKNKKQPNVQRNMNGKIFFLFVYFICAFNLSAQQNYKSVAEGIIKKGLNEQEAYTMLTELTSTIGARLSGSPQFAKAIEWGKRTMESKGFDSVWLEPVKVPHWVRNSIEKASLIVGKKKLPLAVCALGGSIATAKKGMTAEVIEVHSFEEVRALGEKAKGKIIFYNRPFDKTKANTGEAYGGAVEQRTSGSVEAAKVGAVGVIVRSMTNALDNQPHTGAMNYNDSIPKIPAAAVSTLGANLLSEALQKEKNVRVSLQLNCETLPDVDAFNVIGQLRGTEKPNEVILLGGHLDSWDKGTGAHDDGAGCVQSIEAVRILKSLGMQPKRTIRVVLFANEENGLRGGKAYADNQRTSNEKHIAAIESDFGGGVPRGFGVDADSLQFEKIKSWSPIFDLINADKIRKGGGGADISPLSKKGVPLIGLNPDGQRYFDYHHSHNDTIDKVHPRELELGAIAMSMLSWLLAEEGL